MALRRKALHVGMLVPYRNYVLFDLFDFCFFFRLLPVGHQVRPEVIEITTVPRLFGAIRTPPLVPGPGRQAQKPSHPS